MTNEEKLADYKEVRILADKLEGKLRLLQMLIEAHETIGRDVISIETLKNSIFPES